jgi:hypothetical protein
MTTPPRDLDATSPADAAEAGARPDDERADDERADDERADDELPDGSFEETPSAELAHQRIAAAIGALGADARPSADWQSRVLAGIRARTPTAPPVEAAAAAASVSPATASTAAAPAPASAAAAAPADPGMAPVIPLHRRRVFRVVTASTTMVAAAAALLLWVRGPKTGLSPQLLVEITSTAKPERISGERARVGATLRFSARSAAPHRALWIFRGANELVLSCPGQGCALEAQALTAELVVPLVGEYRVVALWSDAPIPAPSGARDADLAAAESAKATRRSYDFVAW